MMWHVKKEQIMKVEKMVYKDRTITESINMLINTISVMSKRIDKLELEIEKLKENHETLDSKR